MPISIKIPTPLRKYTADKDTVFVDGNNVGEVLNNLESAHPGIKTKLIDDDGKVRRFINIYAGDDDIRFLEGLATEVKDGSDISIVPAIAGGF